MWMGFTEKWMRFTKLQEIVKLSLSFGPTRLFLLFTDTQTHRHTDTQTHRHTDTQTHRHTDTQTHTQTNTQHTPLKLNAQICCCLVL